MKWIKYPNSSPSEQKWNTPIFVTVAPTFWWEKIRVVLGYYEGVIEQWYTWDGYKIPSGKVLAYKMVKFPEPCNIQSENK